MTVEPNAGEAPKSPLTLGDALAKLGAATGVITAIAYFQGWVTLRTYYSAMGASWFLPSLTPTRILNEGGSSLLAAGVCAFLAFQSVANGARPKNVDRWAMAAGLLGIALLTWGSFAKSSNWAGPQALHLTASLMSVLLMASAGATVGLLAWASNTPGFTWKSHLNIVYWVYLVAFAMCPAQVGQYRADAHLDPATSPLPIVTRAAAPISATRLVEATGDLALVVRLGVGSQPSAFQVIKLENGVEIAGPSRPASGGK